MSPLKIKTYIINLPKDKARKESILKETAAIGCLDCEVIEAVYGKELSSDEVLQLFNEKKFVCNYSRTLLPGEVGATLSHRKCYEMLLASGYDVALILEDDATFANKDMADDILRKALHYIGGNEPRILLLHADFNSTDKGTDLKNGYSLYSVYDGLFATAYLINRNAARLLLDTERPYWVADDWYRFRKQGVKIYSIYPSVCLQQWESLSSSILVPTEKRQRKRIFSWITFRLIYEKICRMALIASGRLKHFN